MKQYVKELERALSICSMCPTGLRVRDYLEEKKRKEEEGVDDTDPDGVNSVSRRRSFLDIGNRLLEQIIEHTVVASPVEPVVERTEQEKEEDSYNESIKLMIETGNGIHCNYLEKWDATLNIDREFVYPTEEPEILRILDDLAGCYYYDCIRLGALKRKVNRMEEKTMTVLAHYDFFLLEHGIDMMPLCEIVGLDSYKREEHIWECGYSYTLVNYYLDKINADGGKKLTPAAVINGTPELTHAVEKEFITADGQLLRPASDFVRFCIENEYFRPWGRPAFRRISGVLKRDDGTPVDENTLAQAYSDIKKTIQGDDLRTE